MATGKIKQLKKSTKESYILETFPRCAISILSVHISLLYHCFAYCVFFFPLPHAVPKEPYRETSMGVRLNIAHQM